MSISQLPVRESRTAVVLAQLSDALDQLDQIPGWQLGDGELLGMTEKLYRHLGAANARALALLAEVDARGLAPDAGRGPRWCG